jgi:hypothetical protein
MMTIPSSKVGLFEIIMGKLQDSDSRRISAVTDSSSSDYAAAAAAAVNRIPVIRYFEVRDIFFTFFTSKNTR